MPTKNFRKELGGMFGMPLQKEVGKWFDVTCDECRQPFVYWSNSGLPRTMTVRCEDHY